MFSLIALLCLVSISLGQESRNHVITGTRAKVSQRRLVVNGDFETCKDHGQCIGNETCCGDPSMCCGAGFDCCGTGKSTECCQTPLESCCPDPKHGSICCEAEHTFCCPPLDQLASRCCPRWNVCCGGGRFGCCDPGNLRASEDNQGYALFSTALLEKGDPMRAYQVDLNTGDTSEHITDFKTGSEITRPFIFSPQLNAFFLPRADFLSEVHNVSLWSINPTTGDVKNTQLSGSHPTGLVTGFCAWSATGNAYITFATYNSDKTGYIFYRTNETGATVVIGTRSFQGEDDYTGWFKRCTPDGTHVFRLGFQNPVTEYNFGLGITKLTSSSLPSNFYALTPPSGLAQYTTIDYVSGSSEEDFEFVSLAGQGDSQGDFSVVQWSLTSAKVLVALKDAHSTVKFGPISTSVNEEGTQFGALCTTRSLLGNKFDRWEMVLVSLVNSQVVQHDLSPWMIGETDSPAGFGFPAKTAEGLPKQ